MIGGIFTSFDISASALRAERSRMNMHANNLANANTTRDEHGNVTPYRRKLIHFRQGAPSITGSEHLGVDVQEIVDDYNTDMPRVHQPWHPDADADGYVTYPNVNVSLEMVGMMMAQRAFEANLTAFESSKQIFSGALQMIA